MRSRSALAWAIGLLATITLLFGIYAWTIFRLGIHLPFSRSIPFPPYEWLLDVERALSAVALAIAAVALGVGMTAVRRRQVSIEVPSWAGFVAVVFILAVVAEITSLLWQEYVLDVPRGLERALGVSRERDVLQYASAVANLVVQWCFLMLTAAAVAGSHRRQELGSA